MKVKGLIHSYFIKVTKVAISVGSAKDNNIESCTVNQKREHVFFYVYDQIVKYLF
jgi:hypothetical protein